MEKQVEASVLIFQTVETGEASVSNTNIREEIGICMPTIQLYVCKEHW
jgi:hypothetical protein